MIFGWTIKWERLYFKSKRIEYRLRIYKPIEYRRPKKKPHTLMKEASPIVTLHLGE